MIIRRPLDRAPLAAIGNFLDDLCAWKMSHRKMSYLLKTFCWKTVNKGG